MKEGPSDSAIRSLIPNHRKLLRSKTVVVSVAGKVGTKIPAGMVERGERKRSAVSVEIPQTMSKPEVGTPSGISSGDVLILPERHPAYRRHEARLGFGTERENLAGDGKGKGTSGGPARPKVPMRRRGADCLVVVTKAL